MIQFPNTKSSKMWQWKELDGVSVFFGPVFEFVQVKSQKRGHKGPVFEFVQVGSRKRGQKTGTLSNSFHYHIFKL